VTLVRWLLIAVVKVYQYLVSPLIGPSCRFHPSCSSYAAQAITRHGPWKGLYLAAARLLRCHPWAAWGEDPVPEDFTFRPWRTKTSPLGAARGAAR
jgi:putative membrane protein insertion efficiency factor